MALPEIIKDIDARVKKSGDTITGKLYTTSNLNGSLACANTNGAFRIDGGTDYQNGAFLALNGADSTYYPNAFQLVASNENERKELFGNIDGTLTWDNNIILHTGNKNLITADDISASRAHKTSWDFTQQHHSNEVTFDMSNAPGAPPGGWVNGFVSTHNNYLSSYIVNTHRTNNWYVGYGETVGVSPTWYKLLHSGNYSEYALPLTGGTMTGGIVFTGSNGIQTRHIDGESTTFGGDLYLNYGVSAPIHFGSGGNYWITGDGLYYTGNCRCLSGYSNNTPALRWHALEFVSNSMTIGTNNGQCQPGSGNTSGVWYYPPEGTYSTSTAANLQVIRLTWQPNVWVNELFFSPNTNKFYHRSVQNGTALNWRQIWEAGDSVTGAVWNDYAEYRESDFIEPGYCLIENGDDTLSKSTKRMQSWAGISSDTWGFAQGQTEKAQTPIAVAGRVLVYPWQDRNNYKPGDCVCTAPDGKVDIMTEEEIYKHPDKIIGVVSCVPDYEEWGGGENADRPPVKVDGRIWVRVK